MWIHLCLSIVKKPFQDPYSSSRFHTFLLGFGILQLVSEQTLVLNITGLILVKFLHHLLLFLKLFEVILCSLRKLIFHLFLQSRLKIRFLQVYINWLLFVFHSSTQKHQSFVKKLCLWSFWDFFLKVFFNFWLEDFHQNHFFLCLNS